MIRFITVFSLFLTFSSSAACWIVEDVRGSSYADRNQYQREDDGFKGKFTILVTGQAATVLYDGADAGGMSYRPLTENVVVGLSSEPGKHAIGNMGYPARWDCTFDQNYFWISRL